MKIKNILWLRQWRERFAKILPPETFVPVLTAILVGGGVLSSCGTGVV